MGFVQRRLVKSVLWIVAHPKTTLAIGLVLVAVAALYAHLRLDVSTDQNDLFSHKVSFFADYLRFNDLFPEHQATYIVIEPVDLKGPPRLADWVNLADQIADRLNMMVPRYVKKPINPRVPIADPKAPGILFDDPSKVREHFEEYREFYQLAQLWGEKPSVFTSWMGKTPMERFLGGLAIGGVNDQGAGFVKNLAASWATTAAHPDHVDVPDLTTMGAEDPSALGYAFPPDTDPKDPPHNVLLIQLHENNEETSLTGGADTIDAIRAAVQDVAKNYPQFKVGLTGRGVLDADENRTTDHDGRKSEIVALIVVFIGLVVFLRSIWLAIVAEGSLAIAIGWTFGWATLSVGRLNLLSTVFLIALIGIGMDYLIQILAAYRREARRYVRPQAIWARVFRYVGPPVNTACLGAAGAFLVSALTDFKGAAELGIIAGGGLLLCLLAGYTVLPAILVLLPAKLEPYAERYGTPPKRTKLRLVLPCLWAIGVIAGIRLMQRNEFNPNLLDLQAPELESVKLVRKLQTWQAVVLSPDLELLRQVRSALDGAPTVAGTESILNAFDSAEYLRKHAADLGQINWAEPAPVTADDLPTLATRARNLAAKFETLAATRPVGDAAQASRNLRTFADSITASGVDPMRIASSLSDWQTRFVQHLKSVMAIFNPPELKVENIPQEIREHLVSEENGQRIYALYINPKDDLWGRENLERFQREVEARVAKVPGAPPVTGITSDIYHTTAAIERAFLLATAYALGLIFILVLIDLRNVVHTLVAVSVLALGLPMLLAFMGYFDVTWNFANFFGLPILIGAGHEYGVFMVHRYKEAVSDPRRVWLRRDPADRALFLCAFVTTSSFGFFWLFAHHKGLKSLGLVMAVGIFCIYLAAIVVVRPLLTWRLEHRRQQGNGGPPGAV
jgi:predicted RND superfamily exporter protein